MSKKRSKAESLARKTAADAAPVTGYDEFLLDLKSRIQSAQIKAAVSINRELITLYWNIGREILHRQTAQG